MFWSNLRRPILALAPMAGVCDSAFKQMCRRGGADVVYTEFVSADALFYNGKKTLEMLAFSEKERPVICQIFGKKPEHFAKAAKVVEELGFDGIDINFGCPAYKVVKHGGGVSLMRNPALCAELVQAVTDNTKIPVSLKIRGSINCDGKVEAFEKRFVECQSPSPQSPPIEGGGYGTVTALDFLPALLHLPIAAIMLHARSYEQPFDGKPNLGLARQVKELLDQHEQKTGKRPVYLINGGIVDGKTAKEALAESGADGIGVGRGSWGKPWIFSEIKSYLKGQEVIKPDWSLIRETAKIHAGLALEAKGPYGLIEVRKHMAWYLKGFPGASAMRARLMQSKELSEIEQILQEPILAA